MDSPSQKKRRFLLLLLQTIFSLKCIFNDALFFCRHFGHHKGQCHRNCALFLARVKQNLHFKQSLRRIRRHNKETPFEFIDTLQTVVEQIVKDASLKQILVILNLLLSKKL